MKKSMVFIAAAMLVCGSMGVKAQKFDHLADTPAMGWNSWNKYQCNINEDLIKGIVDAMVSTGLKDAGYQYVNLDDGWHGQRDADGFIQCDAKKFPAGIKSLADYTHSKGLKLGIYSCCGKLTCAGYPASLGHEYQDALQYARWNIDYLKEDWCYCDIVNPRGAYALMRDALHDAGRPIYFSMCEWGSNKPWEWAKDTGHSWRTTGDIQCSWKSWTKIMDLNKVLRKYAGPGHWNDPDMLEVGNGMPVNEDRAHFTMWCMMSAPLILGNDIRNMKPETSAILLNKEVIALDQDKLGVQGLMQSSNDSIDYWFKPLENGDWAFCVLNRNSVAKKCAINWQQFNFTDDLSNRATGFDKQVYTLRNLWTKKNEGTTKKAKNILVPAHDVVLYRLSAKK
jgi:alpha-galactosidase